LRRISADFFTDTGVKVTLRTDTQVTGGETDSSRIPLQGPGPWSLPHPRIDHHDRPMSDIRSSREPDSAPGTEPQSTEPQSTAPATSGRGQGVEPLRLPPLLPRRQNPWLLVEVDGSAAGHGALVWAMREAARREATVVAVAVLHAPDGDPLEGARRALVLAHLAAHERLEAQVLRAIAETGVHGRTRTAVLDRALFDALTAATLGADLVVVGPRGKTLLRQAVPRPPARRLARGA
jgi:nucleotide-binding universal stress UspA family protein